MEALRGILEAPNPGVMDGVRNLGVEGDKNGAVGVVTSLLALVASLCVVAGAVMGIGDEGLSPEVEVEVVGLDLSNVRDRDVRKDFVLAADELDTEALGGSFEVGGRCVGVDEGDSERGAKSNSGS